MNKIIYTPKFKALEYASYAANFYTGCSGCCSYCYNRKGITAKVLGADKPSLRKCFKDETDAINKFQIEIQHNIELLMEKGIFFSFVGDPLSPQTKVLFLKAANFATRNEIPVTFLTKQVDWVEDFIEWADNFECEDGSQDWRKLYNFGFTLTGIDELEPGCPTNAKRIEAMKFLHENGFKVWVSLEPVIDIDESYNMFVRSYAYADKFKIGLLSGKKFDKESINTFVTTIKIFNDNTKEIIFKESILKLLK